jgi:small conductance mechanosensitive channel
MPHVTFNYMFFIKMWVPKLIAALIVLALFVLVAVVARRIFLRVLGAKNGSRRYAIELLANMLRASIIIVGIVTAMGTMGINVAALVAGLGLTGFALGLALKDLLSNIISGLLVLLYKPFKVDDVITMGNFTGKVAKIDLRYTTLDGTKEGANTLILIPNSQLLATTVVVEL